MRTFTQKLAFLLVALLCFAGVPQKVMADCVAIGDGTSASAYYSPISTYYHNSYSQQLYLADEMNLSAGSITSIAFAYTASSSTKRTISIYMANTDATSLSTSYVTDGFEEVLSAAEIEFDNSSDWFTIDLETPFAYDGSSNLVVAVYMNYASSETNYSSGYRFLQTSVSGMTRYTNNDTSSPDQLTVTDGVVSGSGSTTDYRPNIQLCYTSSGVQEKSRQ